MRSARGDIARVEQLRTNRNSCPVPKSEIGRYNVNRNAPLAGIAPHSLKAVPRILN
jgi:hypothetical protein